MPYSVAGKHVVLYELRCRAPDCQARFYICPRCYRGQCYCGPPCRARTRAQQRRAANARHQQTKRGRLHHSRRQRAYRDRLRGRGRQRTNNVTDPSSIRVALASSCGYDVSPSRLPPHGAMGPTRRRPRPRAWPALRCSICGCPGLPAGRSWRPHTRWCRPWRGRPPEVP